MERIETIWKLWKRNVTINENTVQSLRLQQWTTYVDPQFLFSPENWAAHVERHGWSNSVAAVSRLQWYHNQQSMNEPKYDQHRNHLSVVRCVKRTCTCISVLCTRVCLISYISLKFWRLWRSRALIDSWQKPLVVISR